MKNSIDYNSLLQKLEELKNSEAAQKNKLNSLYKQQDLLDEQATPLEYMRHNTGNIAAGLAFVFVAGAAGSSLNVSAKNPDIFDLPATGENVPTIQAAAKDDLKNYTTAATIDARLASKVTTTSTERTTWQNLAIAYALNHKKGYVDKKDGKAQELMDATTVYNQLSDLLSKNPNYKKPTAMLPQQKVGYDITFCLQQLGYGKDATGKIRNFDTKDYLYTNDLIIAIMDFQNDKGIKREGIVGPETFRHFMQAMKGANTITGDLNISITKEVPTNKDVNVTINSSVSVTNTNNQVATTSKDTLKQTPANIAKAIDSTATINKSDVQVTLEKYFTGRELGFIEPTVSYINNTKDKGQSLLKEISDADKSTDPIVDKKATLLCIFESYGIKNEIIILDDQIQAHQGKKDSLTLKSLTEKRDELLKKTEFVISEQQCETSVSNDANTTKVSVDRLVKKDLPKKIFKKFNKAVIAIIGSEPTEETNIQELTWENLMRQEILPENLQMTFNEFSSLQPENFVALLKTNKAKWN